MADEKLEQTADEFRRAVRQAAERGRLAPAGSGAGAAAIDPDAIAAAVEARLATGLSASLRREVSEAVQSTVADAVARAMAKQPQQTAAPLDPALVRRLEAAAQSLAKQEDGSEDVLQELRNVLPRKLGQEMQHQSHPIVQRLSGVERQLSALQANDGFGREALRLALVALIVLVIAIGVTAFERQIQNWARDTLYPLVGLSIKEAAPSAPRPVNAVDPPERR